MRLFVMAMGLGPIGSRVVTALTRREGVTVVAAVDADPEKVGHDLSQVSGESTEVGIAITSTVPDAPPEGGVAIHAVGSDVREAAPQIADLVQHGWNVVSTCEQLSVGCKSEEPVAHEIHAAALAGDRTVLGTGINPGFMMDTLPLVLTTVCTEVAAIRVRRVVDTNQRRIPLQRKSGVGLKVSEFMALAERGEIGHVGLRESATSVGTRMKWSFTKVEATLDPIIATGMTVTGLGSVRSGLVIGQRQVLRGYVGDSEVLRMELDMAAGATPIDEVHIDGRPPLHELIDGGVNGDIGTEAVICNLVRPVYEARPGLLTMMDFVVLGCDA